MRLITTFIIMLCGFLTCIMMNIFPVAGGGAAMIFIITVPFTGISGIILAGLYYFKISKLKNERKERILLSTIIILLLLVTFVFFPFP